jgi:hypothetical protein
MKIETIQLKTIVNQSKNIDATDLNGEKVMMNLDMGKYFALNEVGSRIWEIIHEPITAQGVIDILLQEYEVEYEICKKNVLEFIGRLNDDKLICIS